MCFKIYKKSIEHDDHRIHRFRIDYKNEYENYQFDIYRKKNII